MGLFGFSKKKDAPSCKWECHPAQSSEQTSEQEAPVKVLGSGCDKCRALEKAAIEALKESGREPWVQHVTDFAEIAKYGVMQPPALVVDGKVVSYGKVLSKEEVLELL